MNEYIVVYKLPDSLGVRSRNVKANGWREENDGATNFFNGNESVLFFKPGVVLSVERLVSLARAPKKKAKKK